MYRSLDYEKWKTVMSQLEVAKYRDTRAVGASGMGYRLLLKQGDGGEN